jgi:hypothetical protein
LLKNIHHHNVALAQKKRMAGAMLTMMGIAHLSEWALLRRTTQKTGNLQGMVSLEATIYPFKNEISVCLGILVVGKPSLPKNWHNSEGGSCSSHTIKGCSWFSRVSSVLTQMRFARAYYSHQQIKSIL